MKQKILKKGLILLIVCILSIGSAVSIYAACAHTFNGQYDTIKQPTCNETGTKVGRCTKCNAIVTTVTIPATGHSWKFVKSTEYYDLYKCANCGELWPKYYKY
jgi:uncharacterized protein with PIN domain